MMRNIWNWIKEQNLFVKIVFGIVGFALIVSGALYLLSWITMSLWNWLMPEIFSLPAITQLQAIGLIVLISIFKGVVTSNNSNNNKTIHVKDESFPNEKDDFDAKYEEWWNKKGEEAFNQYIEGNE